MEAGLRKFIADFWAEPMTSTRRDRATIPELGECEFGYVDDRRNEAVLLTVYCIQRTFIWKTQKQASNSFWDQNWLSSLRDDVVSRKMSALKI
jgi:hypothetical protein